MKRRGRFESSSLGTPPFFAPSALDVGCRTGRMLDLGLTTPDRYAVIDPIQPMQHARAKASGAGEVWSDVVGAGRGTGVTVILVVVLTVLVVVERAVVMTVSVTVNPGSAWGVWLSDPHADK